MNAAVNGFPSSSTVHAPQSPVSQALRTLHHPSLRNADKRLVPGRIGSSHTVPLTVSRLPTLMPNLPSGAAAMWTEPTLKTLTFQKCLLNLRQVILTGCKTPPVSLFCSPRKSRPDECSCEWAFRPAAPCMLHNHRFHRPSVRSTIRASATPTRGLCRDVSGLHTRCR